MNQSLAALLLLLLFVSLLSCYRLWLHPLRNFPGPALAAITGWYRVYYTAIDEEGWVAHLEKLHQLYGPVIRVTPSELHFNNPDAFDDIHVTPKPSYIKDPEFYGSFVTPNAVAALHDPQKASKRRHLLGAYFSRRSVLQLEHVVQRTVDTLIERLSTYAETREPADLFLGYRATTLDIITSYLFAQRFNALDSPKFQHPLLIGLDESLRAGWLGRYLPIQLDKWLPEWVLRKAAPKVIPLLDQVGYITRQLDKISADPPSLHDAGHKAIFSVLFDTSKSDTGEDPWVFPKAQVIDECFSLQFAGSDTVGNACMVGTYGLLANKEALCRLRRELDVAWPDIHSPMTWEALERLPYLTIVSCGTYFVHSDPDIFPEPKSFRPERWLNKDSRILEKYLVAFSKGPRICLGINLAWCELYLIFANVFRKLDLEIWNTA
ncbi:hypothetical protein VNI00_008172 [Paramarasmius palmivorus]|uniref:Cytochrome P450 n=1 Tax=Paramarasmius palmivorus TaxID=297713 RepID=A0AAW0CXZ2_9AGAR